MDTRRSILLMWRYKGNRLRDCIVLKLIKTHLVMNLRAKVQQEDNGYE